MPSITSECITSFTPKAVSHVSHTAVSLSMPSESISESHAPITLNVSQNTTAIIRINAGIALYLPVSTLSIISDLVRSLLSCGFTTVSWQTPSIKLKRISAIAAALSSPHSFSICSTIVSIILTSSSSNSSRFKIRLSPSTNFVAAKRTGIPCFFAWSSIRCAIP